MPYEILYESIEDIENKLRSLKEKGVKIEDCIIKINKNNVKFKIRSKNTLYTIVLSPDKLGRNVEELKGLAEELSKTIDCGEPKTL